MSQATQLQTESNELPPTATGDDLRRLLGRRRFVQEELLGTRVWVTDMPGFFGEPQGTEVVIQPEDGTPVDWIDDRLIPEDSCK